MMRLRVVAGLLLWLVVIGVHSTTPEEQVCTDTDPKCVEWASEGHCETKTEQMLKTCPKSCQVCPAAADDTADDEKEADEELNAFFIDIGVPQKVNLTAVDLNEFNVVYRGAVEHLTAVAKNEELRYILKHCKNKDELCVQYALEGGCEYKQPYMYHNCCPVCKAASMLEWLLDCPADPNAPVSWKPGDLNQFFVNLTTLDKYAQYEPTIHSRPGNGKRDKEGSALDPWVVTMENVISPQEAAHLIGLANKGGWKQSFIAGDMQPDGTQEAVLSEDRTSMLSFCRDECYEDPVVQDVIERLSEITGIPEQHSDYLQMLRYQEGQFYDSHHDYQDFQVYSASGVRIMTFYLYLSEVEEGGGTRFPELDITVQPKVGRALVWPNVLDEDPDEWDDRMFHEALPVTRGVKYGVNAWFHQRNFKEADERDCSQ